MPDIIDNVKVGAFIKSLLKKHSMTQDALAQKLMVSKSAVSQNLNGKSSFDIQNLMSIATLFKISLDDLLNCRENEEEKYYVSEYVRFANRDLDELKEYNSKNFQIQDPDIYGNVLVDYLIELDKEELFLYLDSEQVEFVRDYFHRAKEIHLKVIVYMLRKGLDGVIRHIQKFSEMNNSFDLSGSYDGLEVWKLLNQPENQDIVKEMLDLKIDQQYTIMGIKTSKQVKVISKNDWVQIIANYKLENILEVYLDYYGSADDLLSFSGTMLLYEYSKGVLKFIERFFLKEFSSNAKAYYNFQKTMSLVVDKGDFHLFQKLIEYHVYENLTNTIVTAIEHHKKEYYEYCLKDCENRMFEPLDYSKIGYGAVKQSNIEILEIIQPHLNPKALNYLLSEVLEGDVKVLYYLISLGAVFDFKYYNSNTMNNSNAIIQYLFKKGVK